MALARASLPLVEIYSSVMVGTLDATAWRKFVPLLFAGVALALAGALQPIQRHVP